MPLQRKERNGQLQAVEFSDFTGGINSSVAPQLLAPNESLQIKNFEYLQNRLVTRGGLSAPLATYEKDIKTFFYDDSTNTYLVVLVDGKVYEENLTGTTRYVGTLVGNAFPQFCRFDGNIFIASGGKLQYFNYTGHSLTTISASKLCDYVFERFGRLVVTHSGDDNLYYSAVGDPYETGWTEDSNDDSSAKFVEIGYKDDGDILKVMPISGDIAIFKTNGRVYGLSGEFPNWTVQMVADQADALTADGIDDVVGAVAFMTMSGLKSLGSTSSYGNFALNTDFARKFNLSLISGSVNNPKVRYINRKSQLMICPNTTGTDGKKKWFCYQNGLGSCLYFEFALPITEMQDTRDDVIIASGKSLYRWSMEYSDDNGTPIDQLIETREFASSRRLFTRMIDVGIKGTEKQPVFLRWANKELCYLLGDRRNEKFVFSVCRQDTLKISTQAQVAIDFVKFYVSEV